MKTNYEYRADARAALKGKWGPAILVTLLASLPSLIAQAVASSLNSPMADVIYRYLYAAYYQDTVYELTDLVKALSSTVTTGTYVAAGLAVAAFVLLPFLNLGFLHHTLHLMRGESAEVGDVLSRRHIIGKAIGESLLKWLIILGWGLLGVAGMYGLLTLGLMTQNTYIAELMGFAGSVLYFFLLFRAVLTYFLADYLMADRPETGVVESLRRSRTMMTGSRSRLGGLLFSFIGWSILCMAATAAADMISVFVGTMVSMLGQLVLNLYVITTASGFYLEMTRKNEGMEFEVSKEKQL